MLSGVCDKCLGGGRSLLPPTSCLIGAMFPPSAHPKSRRGRVVKATETDRLRGHELTMSPIQMPTSSQIVATSSKKTNNELGRAANTQHQHRQKKNAQKQ